MVSCRNRLDVRRNRCIGDESAPSHFWITASACEALRVQLIALADVAQQRATGDRNDGQRDRDQHGHREQHRWLGIGLPFAIRCNALRWCRRRELVRRRAAMQQRGLRFDDGHAGRGHRIGSSECRPIALQHRRLFTLGGHKLRQRGDIDRRRRTERIDNRCGNRLRFNDGDDNRCGTDDRRVSRDLRGHRRSMLRLYLGGMRRGIDGNRRDRLQLHGCGWHSVDHADRCCRGQRNHGRAIQVLDAADLDLFKPVLRPG